MPQATVTLLLPPQFVELCKRDQTSPEVVLRGFVADLCKLHPYAKGPRTEGYASHSGTASAAAWAYYERVGYPCLRG